MPALTHATLPPEPHLSGVLLPSLRTCLAKECGRPRTGGYTTEAPGRPAIGLWAPVAAGVAAGRTG
ncbi:hypothetical protein ACFWY5_25320 [Nonomuraea sp. NPDC059007]|uniref:hypothetical protein n=1 Tax=Nonomuraea sp. NPDC059007 TaxID=3346692 RepID=UPI003697FDD5